MHWAEGFIAVDWGTTNRRGYLIGGDGRLEDEMEDDSGILSVSPGGFPAAVEEIRSRLGDRPLVMAGMIGSNRGWVEAPYVPCPAGIDDLAQRLIWAEQGKAAIVPGLSYLSDDAADVMRGEEVQILGAVAAGMIPENCLVCHPGTHNKWVTVENGRITGFRTVMTGEMFSLLKQHSILSDLLEPEAETGPAFTAGVDRGLSEDGLLAQLFSVRARVLLGRARKEDQASYASGLLIGSDVRVGLRLETEGAVVVMGRPDLTSLYAAALAEAGRETKEVDGEEAFIAGARQLAERMQ